MSIVFNSLVFVCSFQKCSIILWKQKHLSWFWAFLSGYSGTLSATWCLEQAKKVKQTFKVTLVPLYMLTDPPFCELKNCRDFFPLIYLRIYTCVGSSKVLCYRHNCNNRFHPQSFWEGLKVVLIFRSLLLFTAGILKDSLLKADTYILMLHPCKWANPFGQKHGK